MDISLKNLIVNLLLLLGSFSTPGFTWDGKTVCLEGWYLLARCRSKGMTAVTLWNVGDVVNAKCEALLVNADANLMLAVLNTRANSRLGL
mmetsp:Transcript_23/g.57  ORF Transcript_23/g.57 Transcript_23/m.57 type:complete len:90 (-) Transcript_23:59-328(-)